MREDWNTSPDKDRQADTITNFILFCEDEVNEPNYFKSFEKPGVKVNTVKNQSSDFRNVMKVLAHCEENQWLAKNDEQYEVKSDIANYIWSVFDRDVDLSVPTPEKQKEHEKKLREDNINFTSSIRYAESSGIKVAWSNDAFELWILLHFEEVTSDIKTRLDIYARLTEIFKALPDQPAGMLKITGHSKFNYKDHAKSEKFFTSYVKPLLMLQLQEAIGRAQELEKAFSTSLYHEMNPCTKVHHLVISLLQHMR